MTAGSLRTVGCVLVFLFLGLLVLRRKKDDYIGPRLRRDVADTVLVIAFLLAVIMVAFPECVAKWIG